ncbi:MAG: glycosyltransferase [Phycisphaerae bacterium]
MKIAYLTSMYPDVSHTFILREVLAMRAAGVQVVTFSVRRPNTRNVLGPDAAREASATRWLVPPPLGLLVRAMVWTAAARPGSTIRTLLDAVMGGTMTIRRRTKWLCYFAEAVLLAYWLTTESFDHLHCHFGNSGSSTGMLAARLAGIPFSVTVHGSELRDIDKHRLPDKIAHAAFVACVSRFGKSQLMLACKPDQWDKIHVVRCGVSCTNDRAPIPHAESGAILCVARLSLEKGHFVLLDALAILREKGIDARCTLVGDGPMRSAVETRAARLNLQGMVTFTGALEPHRVTALYQAAKVVVLASLSEGVPVVLMEAMACSRPVVATWVGGVPELVENGRSGLVVPPGDPEALAEALRLVLTDAELARRLGENGAQRVRNRFNIEEAVHQLAALFSDHMANSGAASSL